MIDKLFRPRSVAVIGASREPGKVGHDVVKNLLASGFPGKIFPVNPKAKEILGLPCWPDIASVPEAVDLAVVAIPARLVPQIIEACGEKKVPVAVILSAGFREAGAEGARLEAQVLKIARKYGLRILGPNCLGVMDTATPLNATFAAQPPLKGEVGFFSQSGALCLAVLEWSRAKGVGLSRFVSLGNKSDISEIDCLRALADDPQTKVILGYLEGVTDGQAFLKMAREVTRKKPVIILKGGTTAAGAKAASSHTGSLAGSEQAYQAAFKQTGIVRAEELEEFLNLALAFALQPPPSGPNVVVVTNSGGPGILTADASERQGLHLPSLERDTVERLRQILPPYASFYNPVDVLGDADAERYEKVLSLLLKEKDINALIVILSTTATIDPQEAARRLAALAPQAKGTSLVTCFLGSETSATASGILLKAQIPNFEYPEKAVSCLAKMWHYRTWLMTPEEEPVSLKIDRRRAAAVIAAAKQEKRRQLYEHEVKEILRAYGFTFPRSLMARTSDEALLSAKAIGYPVVMKIISPSIIHKTDVGGVWTNITSEEELLEAFFTLTSRARKIAPSSSILGVLIQEMVSDGRETILGFSRDPQFGPLIMFGLGGIYVEVLKDVSFRLAPFGRGQAQEMIREIRGYPLLKGVRGQPEADLEALSQAIIALAQLTIDFPELTEGDINPLMVRPRGRGALAVDARLTLGG